MDKMVDTATLFAASGIDEERLLTQAKAFLAADFEEQGAMISDSDFAFRGPVVGPLDKESYLKAITGFDVFTIFPDLDPRYYGFVVDPLEAGRVWAISRATGSNDGKHFETPPQAVSMIFDSSGKVTKFTIGHVMDVSVGNTGGMGGLFGPLWAVGKGLPFREAQPYKKSRRYALFTFVGNLASRFQK